MAPCLSTRHGRACPGHPRLFCVAVSKAWMPGTRPGMTGRGCRDNAGLLLRRPVTPSASAAPAALVVTETGCAGTTSRSRRVPVPGP
ncbi:hypothetical protein D4Q52_02335 [Rhodopseudomonas palustris]|uniref:Uncharacterized protein n=1 Tax=Rhodopseudomonas palustris TaxID=1076 RepID=A0A418VNH1_RHOPL|nr:hypothetical protein D4Q52_02335 [Rhodopseudomonas palustris]